MSARITLTNICATLGKRDVLLDVSASFEAGEFVGIVGPNGAGKSTLLRAIAGLQPINSGTIHLGERLLDDHSHRERAAATAYLPQARPVAWNISVEDLAALGRFGVGVGRYATSWPVHRLFIDAALDKAGATEFVGRPVHTLSGGEQARAHLARMLASPASTLLLDEPCAALDIRHQLDLMATLKAECEDGRTTIAALHDLTLASHYCDRVIVLDKGLKVADGSPAEALSDETLETVFDVRKTSDGFTRA